MALSIRKPRQRKPEEVGTLASYLTPQQKRTLRERDYIDVDGKDGRYRLFVYPAGHNTIKYPANGLPGQEWCCATRGATRGASEDFLLERLLAVQAIGAAALPRGFGRQPPAGIEMQLRTLPHGQRGNR